MIGMMLYVRNSESEHLFIDWDRERVREERVIISLQIIHSITETEKKNETFWFIDHLEIYKILVIFIQIYIAYRKEIN